MKASLETLHKFFDNSSSQFYIPIFQREYVWVEDNIEKLLEDIENVLLEKNESHFFGNVIYKIHTFNNVLLKQLIDGQQRITSFFLLFNGLKNELNKIKEHNLASQITELFLENRFIAENYKLKLKPEVDGTEIYKLIASNDILELESNKTKYSKNNLYKNYFLIVAKIQDWVRNFPLSKIFAVFSKLKIVEIVIEEEDKVNVQKIFESINSTGISLTNFDLIRNFLLINLENTNQNYFFEHHWLPFANRLIAISNTRNVDKFLRILIQFLKKEYIFEKNIYKEFIVFFNNMNEYEIIEKLNYALNLFEHFYNKNSKEVKNVDYESFLFLEPVKNELYSTVYMIILEKFRNKEIDNNEYRNSIKILSEYILRRKIGDFDTSPITKFFNETLLKIHKIKKDFSKNLYNELFENTKNTQMYAPTNDEIKERIKFINFYKLNICKTFLWYLENWNNPIHLNYNNLTIEHIAPVKGDPTWFLLLNVENQEEYENKINQIGNLTLLTQKANSKLSNFSWTLKKEKLNEFKHIKMNEELIAINEFNINHLEKRQNNLIENFFNIFK